MEKIKILFLAVLSCCIFVMPSCTVFDATHESPDNPMTAKISSLVDGWTVAMERMHVGDSCRVVIPQNLGYGERSQNLIKPYSTLIFDIKLMEIVRR